jgi:hypothetical protein
MFLLGERRHGRRRDYVVHERLGGVVRARDSSKHPHEVRATVNTCFPADKDGLGARYERLDLNVDEPCSEHVAAQNVHVWTVSKRDRGDDFTPAQLPCNEELACISPGCRISFGRKLCLFHGDTTVTETCCVRERMWVSASR